MDESSAEHGKDFVFAVVPAPAASGRPHKKYVLGATSASEKASWMEALHRAVDAAPTPVQARIEQLTRRRELKPAPVSAPVRLRSAVPAAPAWAERAAAAAPPLAGVPAAGPPPLLSGYVRVAAAHLTGPPSRAELAHRVAGGGPPGSALGLTLRFAVVRGTFFELYRYRAAALARTALPEQQIQLLGCTVAAAPHASDARVEPLSVQLALACALTVGSVVVLLPEPRERARWAAALASLAAGQQPAAFTEPLPMVPQLQATGGFAWVRACMCAGGAGTRRALGGRRLLGDTRRSRTPTTTPLCASACALALCMWPRVARVGRSLCVSCLLPAPLYVWFGVCHVWLCCCVHLAPRNALHAYVWGAVGSNAPPRTLPDALTLRTRATCACWVRVGVAWLIAWLACARRAALCCAGEKEGWVGGRGQVLRYVVVAGE